MKKQFISVLLSGIAILSLTSCGMDKELKTYKKEVEKFYTTVTEVGSSIDGIDAADKNASKDLLKELDKLEGSFEKFSKLSVPEEFASCESLADDAYDYMSRANELYHEAFEDEYDSLSANQARIQYNNSIKCINYIGILLQGEEPKDAIVSEEIIDEDEEFEADDEDLFSDDYEE